MVPTLGVVNTRASPPTNSTNRRGRGSKGSEIFPQPVVTHYSPHTPHTSSRGRGHNRGKQGGRGQCGGGFHRSGPHSYGGYDGHNYRDTSPARHGEYVDPYYSHS